MPVLDFIDYCIVFFGKTTFVLICFDIFAILLWELCLAEITQNFEIHR